MKKTKICMVINNFPPAIGGAELYTEDLSERLAEMGHVVSVLTRHPDIENCSVPGTEVKNDVKIRRFRTGWVPGLRFIIFFLMVAFWLARNRNKIDIIHAYHVFSTGFMACLIGKVLGKPVIIRDGELRSSVNAYYGSRLIRPMVKYTMSRTKTYVDNSNLIDVFGKFSKDADVSFLQNPVDTDKFRPGLGEGIRRSLRLGKGFIVSYIGRLVPEKGLENLLSAFRRFLKTDSNAKLMIVGYGPEEENLRKLSEEIGISGNAVFTGKVPFDDVQSYYNAADVIVQASVTEETPNTVIQAMSSGNAIIATDLVMAGTLKHNENAFIVKSGSSNAIEEALEKLSTNSKLRKKLGKNARKTAESFGWESHIKEVLRMYGKLLS